MEEVKVSAKSNPKAVAGAISGILRTQGMVEVKAIGAGPVNTAAKAIAIARSHVASSGIDLICVPAFEEKIIKGEEKTIVKFIVQPR